MNNRDFCYWMQGYCELHGMKLSSTQWELVVEHMKLAQQVDKSGYYNFDHFVEMLQGFIDVNGIDVITATQWAMIKSKLQNCFEKVTSDLEDLEKGAPFISPDDLQEMLKDVVREQQTRPYQPPPPYVPQPNPHNPFQDPKQPWKTPDIICSDGTDHNPLEGMPISTCKDSKAFCMSTEEVACQSSNPDDLKASLDGAYDSHNNDATLFEK